MGMGVSETGRGRSNKGIVGGTVKMIVAVHLFPPFNPISKYGSNQGKCFSHFLL